VSISVGFPPIAAADAQVLVLGSMPGRASLAAMQYYAHPRNQFWRIIAALLGVDSTAAYADKAAALRASGIALWDVLHSCRRVGSLDARIESDTLLVNDFRQFFAEHAQISRVFFNGAKAEEVYRRHVLPGFASGALEYRRLPSTSPANASSTFAEKLEAWRALTS
jgi:hypoxanthine-DNA glycosylase